MKCPKCESEMEEINVKNKKELVSLLSSKIGDNVKSDSEIASLLLSIIDGAGVSAGMMGMFPVMKPSLAVLSSLSSIFKANKIYICKKCHYLNLE